MNVFIIPSWYPSEFSPYTGIFFREQAQLFAKYQPDWVVGISTWGSHEPRLWLPVMKPLTSLLRYGSKPVVKKKDSLLEANCVEFLTPAFTWTRRIRKGNIEGIIAANEENLNRFMQNYSQPDVIHAHVAYPAGYIAQRLSEKYDIPYVITEHMSPFPMPSFKGDIEELLLPPLRNASRVIAVGKKLSEELASYGISSTIVDNFIDFDNFKAENRHSSTEVPLLFHLGRLEDQKNQSGLLSALAECKDKKWRLMMVGEGSRVKRLKLQAARLGLSERIFFKKRMSQEEIAATLKECSLFLLPSKHESFGVAALEALASGVPVLMTRCGGIDEKLTSEVAQIVEQGHDHLVNGLKEVLIRLEQFDADRIRTFGEENFAPKRSCQKLEEIYRSLVKSKL